MDEAHEILLSSLKSSGVSLPVGVSSIKGLSSAALVSICAQSIHMFLDCAPSSFPTSLPGVTAERFKICAELAAAIKSLGYRDELGFHQFLYPSDEESYKLVRFLVERLSKESSDGKKVGMTRPHDASKLEDEIKDLKRQEMLPRDEVHAETFRVQKLQDEHNILKMPLDLAVNRQQSNELCIQEPDAVVKSRQQGVMELETKGNVAEHALKEQRMNEQTFYSEQPEVQGWLIQLKDIEQEIEATLAEISKREAEHLDLLKEFEEQPKLPSRKSYIERITEITKNSRKLDADIKQILKETRELQLESNSIQERLHRTHAVADEVVFREAKKDAVGRLAYRHLSGIHDCFQQIAGTILATDRAKREAAGLEAKLAKLSSRGFDIAKLQADLDSIRKENEVLEQKCNKYSPIS